MLLARRSCDTALNCHIPQQIGQFLDFAAPDKDVWATFEQAKAHSLALGRLPLPSNVLGSIHE